VGYQAIKPTGPTRPGLQSGPESIIRGIQTRDNSGAMTSVFPFFITAFVSLFAIIDAIGNAPMFLSITPHNTNAERVKMAAKAAVAVFIILMVFALLGNRIFQFFGITIDAFRIAGGLILLKISLDMVEAKSLRTRHTPEEDQEGLAKDDVAIIPLAMPMLSGPGAISTVIVLTAQATSAGLRGALFMAIGMNAGLVYLILGSSARVVALFKETGMRILTRILGIVLASIAIQFILTGLRSYMTIAR
jgi:multiple antibiotic resistance protein